MRNLLLGFLVFGTCAFYSAEAKAEDVKGACKEDVEKFCRDVKKGHGAIVQCLRAHEADLSEACKSARAEMNEQIKQRREEIVAACKDDAAKVCADVKPGRGAIAHCLRDHSGQLSEGCKNAMQHAHDKGK